jgi:hypothetical protein
MPSPFFCVRLRRNEEARQEPWHVAPVLRPAAVARLGRRRLYPWARRPRRPAAGITRGRGAGGGGGGALAQV